MRLQGIDKLTKAVGRNGVVIVQEKNVLAPGKFRT
jgi:hypothetical protein